MLAVLLLGLPRELVREELHGAHRLDQIVDMVLRKVASDERTQPSGLSVITQRSKCT